MKKHLFTFGLCLIWIGLILLQSDQAAAQELGPLTPDEARAAAEARLQEQVALGCVPRWEGAAPDQVIHLYDLSGTVSAYLFPVERDGENAGYLTVAALSIPNPVIEFSPNAAPPLWANLATAAAVAEAQGMELCTGRPLYAGVLRYGYELAPVGECETASSTDVRQIVDLFSSDVVEVDAERAQVPLSQVVLSATSFETQDPSAPLAYKLISGVPDYCQFKTGGCWSGCAPTASANLLGYWDAHGYPSLQSGENWQQLVLDLGGCMSTNCGSTNIGNISPGMVSYARTKGYYFESELIFPNASYSLFRSEIDADHPIVVDLIEAVEYWGGNHSVTGVGYQTSGNYMIVHDALACGANQGDHYIHYGSGYYKSIGMHPTAPDITRPSKASNIRPDGWSGPYTSDTTPSFRWDPASDGGSGVAGYYVAVDDWTPEGGSGNDWWVEDVTAFTVPDALSDGEHIFAVTSKDNAGNVNPSNTNQPGDAPYYTFYVDTTAPTNPDTVSPGCNAQDAVWQRDCTDPAFTWSGADDHGGSGVQDYHIYWGTDPAGAPAVWRTTASYDPGAIDPLGGVATYYLRISTRDKLGHESVPEMMFTLRYDGSAPTANPLVARGVDTVHSLQVSVEARAQDTGSGLATISLSNDGLTWHSEPYMDSVAWTLEPLNRRLQTVYLEVEDKAGNRSSRYPCWACLDLYPAHPSSEDYRLWSAGPIAAGNRASSSSHRLSSTAGQSAMGGDLSSANYRLRSGFQALWPANPGSEMFTPFSCQHRIYLPITLRGNR